MSYHMLNLDSRAGTIEQDQKVWGLTNTDPTDRKAWKSGLCKARNGPITLAETDAKLVVVVVPLI